MSDVVTRKVLAGHPTPCHALVLRPLAGPRGPPSSESPRLLQIEVDPRALHTPVRVHLVGMGASVRLKRTTVSLRLRGKLIVDLVSDDEFAYAECLSGMRLRLLAEVSAQHLAHSFRGSKKLGGKCSLEFVGVSGTPSQK